MTTRIQLDFSDAAYERLTAIRRDSKADTNAQTVRQALRLYEWYLRKVKDGLDVVAVDRTTGREYRVVLDDEASE